MHHGSPSESFADLLQPIVRRHLAGLDLEPARGVEVEEELIQLLADLAAEDPDLDPDAPDPLVLHSWLRRQIPDWPGLVHELNRRAAGGPTDADLHSDHVRRTEPCHHRSARRSTSTRRRLPMTRWLDELAHDLRFALRMLIKKPVLATAAVLTLGLGVGLYAAVFSVVDAVIFRPVLDDADDLVNIYTQTPDGFSEFEPMSFADLQDLRNDLDGIESIEAWCLTALALDDGVSQMAVGTQVTPGYFELLGIDAAAGRVLSAQDADSPVVVLGYDTWQTRFGGDAQVLGRTIRLNGTPFTIVGVAQRGFRGLFSGLSSEVFLPIRMARQIDAYPMQSSGRRTEGRGDFDDRAWRWVWALGRLAPGTDQATAETEVSALAAQLAAAYPDTNVDRGMGLWKTDEVRVLPDFDRPMRAAGLLALGLAGLVLLIACANLANVLLARALGRRQEMATRMALGAGRLRLLRQIGAESVVLALAGGVVGLAVARGAVHHLSGLDLPSPIPFDLGLAVDHRVAAFALGASLLSGLLVALWPAAAAARMDLANVLRQQGRGGGGRRHWVRSVLVVGQVAISMVLLVAAGLMVRSHVASLDADPGFRTDGVLVAYFAPTFQGLEEERVDDFFRRIEERIEGMPGVRSVGTIDILPLGLETNTASISALERADRPVQEWERTDTAVATGDYFATMGIDLLAGRTFRPTDDEDASPVVIINQTLAETLWPGEDAVGRKARSDGIDQPVEVVGVVADGKYRSLTEAPRGFTWRPQTQVEREARRVMVRYDGDPAPLMTGIQRAARNLDERVGTFELATIEDQMSNSLFVTRLGSGLLAIIGVFGLLLASVGLYAVVAQLVAERRHEIGVRVAIGADRGSVLRFVLLGGVRLVAAGIVLGTVGALLAGRALRSYLYGVGGTDPVTFGLVPLMLLLVAILACVVPAVRALRISPAEALRYE